MRARNIKAEFWKSEDAGELSYPARLLFMGLWGLADRRGVLPFRAKRIKAEVFPYDDLTANDVEQMVGQMAALHMVTVYVDGDGGKWLHVTNFEKHQNLSGRERKEGTLAGPLPVDEGCQVLNGSGRSGRKFGFVDGSEESGSNGESLGSYEESGNLKSEIGNLKSEGGAKSDFAPSAKLGAISLVDGLFSGVTGEDLARWRETAPGVDLDLELRRAAAWLVENPKRMKKNLRAFVGNWIRRAAENPLAVARASAAEAVDRDGMKAWQGYEDE